MASSNKVKQYSKTLNELKQDFAELIGLNNFYQVDFLKRVLPDEFVETSKVLSDSAQRSNIFNGRYKCYVLKDKILPLLKNQNGEFWDAVLQKCCAFVNKTDQEALRKILRKYITEKWESCDVIEAEVAHNPTTALALIFLNILVDGALPPELCKSLICQMSYLDDNLQQISEEYRSENNYNQYSRMLNLMARVEKDGCIVEKGAYAGHFLDWIRYEICKNYKASTSLLSIRGKTGAGQSEMIQFLFAQMATLVQQGTEARIAPFYINLSKYRWKKFSSAQEALIKDLSAFLTYCERHVNRVPVIFVDSVRTYNTGGSELDQVLCNHFNNRHLAAAFITAEELPAIENKGRERISPLLQRQMWPIYAVMLDPVHISDPSAVDFLQTFSETAPNSLLQSLVVTVQDLRVDSVDIGLLKMLLPFLHLHLKLNDIYEAVCLGYFNGDAAPLMKATQWAYRFAQTDSELPAVSEPISRLLDMHSSILEYLLAKWYIAQFNMENNTDAIRSLTRILPRSVTQFAVPLLNRFAATEHNILKLIEENYDTVGDTLAKSEMTYWLGRIRSASGHAEELLRRYYDKQKTATEVPQRKFCDRKCDLFLLRGIAVSLIVKGDEDVLREYIELLIDNDLANEINRGFHLEYYGDKRYLPAYNKLDLKDDTKFGEKTLAYLLSSNKKMIKNHDFSPILILNLFTAMSLLQARIECSRPENQPLFDVTAYIKHALSQMSQCDVLINRQSEKIKDYFYAVQKDFSLHMQQFSVALQQNLISTEVYTIFSKRVPRQGWVYRCVPENDQESVAMHVYNTWLLGLIFLPEDLEDETYSKSDVLDIILIHDLAEAVTGDIPRPKKSPAHFADEHTEMVSLLMKGTYPSVSNLSRQYSLWQAWHAGKTLNARIAKDLDLIQTLYQLLTYYEKYPDCFTLDDFWQWWSEDSSAIQTEIGKEIWRQVVCENREFQKSLKQIEAQNEYY